MNDDLIYVHVTLEVLLRLKTGSLLSWTTWMKMWPRKVAKGFTVAGGERELSKVTHFSCKLNSIPNNIEPEWANCPRPPDKQQEERVSVSDAKNLRPKNCPRTWAKPVPVTIF